MASVVAGIDWATARVDLVFVANLSLGCNCTNQALSTAVNDSINPGIVFIAIAGISEVNAENISPAHHTRCK